MAGPSRAPGQRFVTFELTASFGFSVALSSDGHEAIVGDPSDGGSPSDSGGSGAAYGFANPSLMRTSGASLTGLAFGRPRLRFHLTATTSAPNLRLFTVALPRGLSFVRDRRLVAGAVVIRGAGKHTLALTHGRLIVKLAGTAQGLSVDIGDRALVESGQLEKRVDALVAFNRRRPRHQRVLALTVPVDVTNAEHDTTTLSLTFAIR
jgi:hypothetical protein